MLNTCCNAEQQQDDDLQVPAHFGHPLEHCHGNTHSNQDYWISPAKGRSAMPNKMRSRPRQSNFKKEFSAVPREMNIMEKPAMTAKSAAGIPARMVWGIQGTKARCSTIMPMIARARVRSKPTMREDGSDGMLIHSKRLRCGPTYRVFGHLFSLAR